MLNTLLAREALRGARKPVNNGVHQILGLSSGVLPAIPCIETFRAGIAGETFGVIFGKYVPC